MCFRWSEKTGIDAPIKENDHAMDDMRYFVMDTLAQPKEDGFFAISVAR